MAGLSGFLVHGLQADVFGNLKNRFNLVIDAGFLATVTSSTVALAFALTISD
jgi:hypothetical protein